MIDYSKITMPQAEAAKYSFQNPANSIVFLNDFVDDRVEVLRITKEGITANPDVPVDEAADAVLRALDGHIKNLVNRPWVGLTDEDIDFQKSKEDIQAAYFAFGALWAEAVLKEKNT